MVSRALHESSRSCIEVSQTMLWSYVVDVAIDETLALASLASS
jgi:hypothetical protein